MLSESWAVEITLDAGVSRLRAVTGGTPSMVEPGGSGWPRSVGSPSGPIFGRKSMAVSPLRSPRVMVVSSFRRGENFGSTAIPTRTNPVSGSRSSAVTSPIGTPDLRIGVPTPTPGASGNWTVYLALLEKMCGRPPKRMTSPASTASAPATNRPSRNFSRRSAMETHSERFQAATLRASSTAADWMITGRKSARLSSLLTLLLARVD